MTASRFRPVLLLLLFLSAGLTTVRGQERAANNVVISMSGGVTAYRGDLTGSFPTEMQPHRGPGWMMGATMGYQFTPGFSFSFGTVYGVYPILDRNNDEGWDESTGPDTSVGGVLQLTAFSRFNHPGRLTPYVDIGASIGASSPVDEDSVHTWGYGPYIGVGADYRLGQQVSFFAGINTAFFSPDTAIDRLGRRGFDTLIQFHVGLRHVFRHVHPIDATIDCTTELGINDPGSFTAYVNEDDLPPHNARWDWGDGMVSEGLTASHSYSAPGRYTVSFVAEGLHGTDIETCIVTVVEAGQPPVLH